MAEFKEVIEKKNRMCVTYPTCEGCPVAMAKKDHAKSCTLFITEHPEEVDKIVMDWAKENPILIKTNADKFKEVFGFYLGTKNCIGIDCPGGNQDCKSCKYKHFWSKEYKEKVIH